MFTRDESKIHMYFVYSILNMHVMCLLLTCGYNIYVLCFCALAREPNELAKLANEPNRVSLLARLYNEP